MAEENFGENLMRMVAAELHFLNAMTASREMYGRGYFSLGVSERAVIDQIVLMTIAGNFQALTPTFLADQQVQQPMGFRGQG
jgi:hypothetical protein